MEFEETSVTFLIVSESQTFLLKFKKFPLSLSEPFWLRWSLFLFKSSCRQWSVYWRWDKSINQIINNWYHYFQATCSGVDSEMFNIVAVLTDLLSLLIKSLTCISFRVSIIESWPKLRSPLLYFKIVQIPFWVTFCLLILILFNCF